MIIENLKKQITVLDMNNKNHIEIYYEYYYGDDLTHSQCKRKALEKLNQNRLIKLNRLMLDELRI